MRKFLERILLPLGCREGHFCANSSNYLLTDSVSDSTTYPGARTDCHLENRINKHEDYWFISNLVPRAFSVFKMAGRGRNSWPGLSKCSRNRGAFCHVTHDDLAFLEVCFHVI